MVINSRKPSNSVSVLSESSRRFIDIGKHSEAIKLHKDWIRRNPKSSDFGVINFNLAVILDSVGEYNDALYHFRRALIGSAEFQLKARLNIGAVQKKLGNYKDALAEWVMVSEKTNNVPLKIIALNNLGLLYYEMGRWLESAKLLERSLQLDPTQDNVLYLIIYANQSSCTWPIYPNNTLIDKERLLSNTSAIAMLGLSDDPEVQLQAAINNSKSAIYNDGSVFPKIEYSNHSRLRVGYLSSNFNFHPVALLTAELFELHDRDKFEIYGFYWGKQDHADIKDISAEILARVRASMDQFIDIHDYSDVASAETIRKCEIDILVDLQGLTSGARPGILSLKPAPIQISYLGHPGTLGELGNDYILADRYVIPESSAKYFSEKILYLPECFQVCDRKRPTKVLGNRQTYLLPEDVFIYCSFNRATKITQNHFEIWMRILKRVPNSILWVLAGNGDAASNLFAECEKHGVSANRLIIAPAVEYRHYLSRFSVADLLLDTFPFNGGTTTSDSLWMGLPVLTLSGRTFASRMSGSLLNAVGLPELITCSIEEYEETAVSLANNPSRLAEYRHRLSVNRHTYPLFDTPRFVRFLEQIFEQVAQNATLETRCEKVNLQTQTERGNDGNQAMARTSVFLYHIAYSTETLQNVESGYRVLDNTRGERHDWREYWPIRNFLSRQVLDDSCFYGFFSPRFKEKTGLSHTQVVDFVSAASGEVDVFLFSPQPDMGAFFFNVFEQEEVFQPGFVAMTEEFLAAIDMPLTLSNLNMDSRQIVFSNYFVARPNFWRAWLTLSEKLFDICEGSDSSLKRSLTSSTNYPGDVQRKVFLMERLASLILTVNCQWKVRAFNTFACAWSASRLSQFKFEAVLSDALKIAMKEQGFSNYRDAFAVLRDKLR